jgi:hypothetical protein
MKKISHPLKAKREENAYIDQNRYLGLCSYCRLAQNCTFARDPNRPVCQCEEFEEITYASIRVPNQRKISPINSSKNLLTREDPIHPYKGLCSSCEERATCVYPKPEGGVWHCEEFR